MTITLRDYQQKAIDACWSALSQGKNALLQAPTGAGKAIMLASIAKRLVDSLPHARIVVIVDREILVKQLSATFKLFFDCSKIGVCCASVSNKKEMHKQIIVASRQTLVNQSPGIVHLVMLDEADMAAPIREKIKDQYATIIERIKQGNARVRIFGCTATPYRLSTGYIYGDRHIIDADVYFDSVTHKITYSELIERAYLVPLIGKVVSSSIDLSDVRITAGEYNIKDLSKCMFRHLSTVREAIDEQAQGRNKIIVFAVDIEHAEALQAMIDNSVTIHSKQSKDAREEALQAFLQGDALQQGGARVAISVAVLSIGFDFPPVDCVIMARPTMSPRLWLQCIGRGLRPHEGKQDCLLIDLVGGARQHCPALTLDKIIVNVPRNAPEQRERHCPECGLEVSKTVRVCHDCGYEWPVERREIVEIAGRKFDDVDFAGNGPTSTHDVYRIELYRNKGKSGKPDTLRVEYHSDELYRSRIAAEFICIEHSGYARTMAERWWIENGKGSIPQTIDQAIAQGIKKPDNISIAVRHGFLRVLSRC